MGVDEWECSLWVCPGQADEDGTEEGEDDEYGDEVGGPGGGGVQAVDYQVLLGLGLHEFDWAETRGGRGIYLG